ncbi:hypothetical protein [Saccharopolyspora aridisoli]|uniref:hypothetical protein n=1 Tax=Saccharopolyspora aridisoli TaxID=2530385 RepID=UPI001F47764E|nr:hypothetical protein [Saccharopolyspora aridisoli]
MPAPARRRVPLPRRARVGAGGRARPNTAVGRGDLVPHVHRGEQADPLPQAAEESAGHFRVQRQTSTGRSCTACRTGLGAVTSSVL